MELLFSGEYCLNKEDSSFEAKSATSGITMSTWESYSAFANSFGGTIVLGLEETEEGGLKVVGLKNADKTIVDIWNTINNPQKVSCNILKSDDVRVIEHNGKKLISITVPRADRHDCPIYINDNIISGTFRRNGPNDYKCTKPEVAGMIRDSEDIALDAIVLNEFDMGDIDRNTLSRYRALMKINDDKHVWNPLPDDELLRLIGAAGRGDDGDLHPTFAGLLMFGMEYRISKEVPNYKLDYLEYIKIGVDWEYRIVSGDGRWTGNVFDFYMNVSNRLKISVGRPFEIDKNWMRVEDTKIDKALRESLVNALIHADYHGRLGIRLELRPNILIVRNPGLFRIPVKEAKEGEISDPRNPTLAKMFNLIGAVERTGSGLYRIIETWKENGFEPPSIEERLNPPTVLMTLPMIMDPKTTAISTEEKIIKLMRADSSISIIKISKDTGISRSRTVSIIEKLKETGRIERIGGKNGGRWIVK